jgi:hypothetical protein
MPGTFTDIVWPVMRCYWPADARVVLDVLVTLDQLNS